MPWGFTSLPQSFNSDNLAASLVCSRAQSTNVSLGRGTNPTMFGSSSQTYFCVPHPVDQNLPRNNQLRHSSQGTSREPNHRVGSVFERSNDCLRSATPGFPFNSAYNHGRAMPASEAWCMNERRADCVWLQPTPKRRRTSSGSLGSSARNPTSNRYVSSGLPVPALSIGLPSLNGIPHLARISNLRTAPNSNLNITHPDPHTSASPHDWLYQCPPSESESVHWRNELRQVSNLVSVAAAAAAAAAAVSQTNTHRQGSFDPAINLTSLVNSQYSNTHNYGSQSTRNPRQNANRSGPVKFPQKRFFIPNNVVPKKRQSSGILTNQRVSTLYIPGGPTVCSPSSSSFRGVGDSDPSKSNHSSPGSSWSPECSTRPSISQPVNSFSTAIEPIVSTTTAELLNADEVHPNVRSNRHTRQTTSQISGSSSNCDISPLTSADSTESDHLPLLINETHLNSLPMDSDLLQYTRTHQTDHYHPCSNSHDNPATEPVGAVGDLLSLAYAACTASEHNASAATQNPTAQPSICISETAHEIDSASNNPNGTDSSSQLNRLNFDRLTANLVSGTPDSQSEEATVVAAAVVASAAAHAVAAAAQAVSAAVNQRRTAETSVFQHLPAISTTHPLIIPVTPTSQNHSSPLTPGDSFTTQHSCTSVCLPSEPITQTILSELTNECTHLNHEHAQLLSSQILANLAAEQNLRTLDSGLGGSNSTPDLGSHPTSACNFPNGRMGCSGNTGPQYPRTVEDNIALSDSQPISGTRFVQLAPTLALHNCLRPVVMTDTFPNRSNNMLNTLSNISSLGSTGTNQQLPTFTYAAQPNFVTLPTEVAAAAAAVAAVAAAANCSTTANNVTYPNAVSLAQRALNISPTTQQYPASSLFTPCLPPLSSFTPIPLISVRSPQPSLIGQESLSTTHDVNMLFQFLRLINQRQDSYALPYYPSAMTATARGSNQSVVVSASGGVSNGSRVASAVTPPLHPHHSTLPHVVNPAVACTVPNLPNNHLINPSGLIFGHQTLPAQSDSQPTSSAAVALAAVAMAAAALQQQTNRHASSNTISMLSAPRAAPTPSIPVPILHAHLYYPRSVATMQQMQDTAHQQCYHNHYCSGQQHQHAYSQRPSSLPVGQPAGCVPLSQPNILAAVSSNSSSPAYLAGLFPFLLTVPASPTPSENVTTSNTTDFSAATLFTHYPSDHSLRIPTPASVLPRNVPDTTSAATAAAAAAAAVAAAAVSVDRLLHWAVQLESNTRRGLTKEELDSLPIHLYSSKKSKGTVTASDSLNTKQEDLVESASNSSLEQERCMICLDDYEEEQQIRKMRCRHEFHAECVDKWLQNKRTCPLCRADAFDGTQRKELFF